MSEYFIRDFKKYLKRWTILFFITVILLVLFLIFYTNRKQAKKEVLDNYYESTNTERVYGDQRVFDYANQLTEEEEAELEAYIHEKEKITLTDIVIVTLNESLADYAPDYRANYSETITPDKYVMVYADKFWEDNCFGYDEPQVLDGTTNTGDGVILVDNIFREPETSKIYTWMGTTGIVEEKFSSDMIDGALDSFYNEVDIDYYYACVDFINSYVSYMGTDVTVPRLGHILPIIIAVIIFISYFFSHKKERLGWNTTEYDTYLIGNKLAFTESRDELLRKEVTRRYNPPSSSSGGSSGGGGHHSSGGGGSHGGGGHSR